MNKPVTINISISLNF